MTLGWRRKSLSSVSTWTALILASLIVSIGTAWAFERGAFDFSVFYAAWSLVLSGRGAEIYSATPDRFLYAPGFAWVLSPLALLPKGVALSFWCFAKAATLGWLIREFGRRVGIGVAAFAVLWVARPLLIDFQYGQVNLLILGACAWGLLGHFDSSSTPAFSVLRGAVLSLAAISKLYPLPLLLVPWACGTDIPKKLVNAEKLGILMGALLMLAIPIASQGISGNLNLHRQWPQAIQGRGISTESHNQSFMAFLHRFFSDQPTHVISEGAASIRMGHPVLSEKTIGTLALGWTCLGLGFLLGWIVTGGKKDPYQWVAVTVGWMIVPSYLLWKPYFVMALPAAAIALNQAESKYQWVLLILVFIGINLTGFDFTGHFMGARLESASLLLFMHLLLLVFVQKQKLTPV